MKLLFLLAVFSVASCDLFSASHEEYRHSVDDADSNSMGTEPEEATAKTVSKKNVVKKLTQAEREEEKRIRALTAELSSAEVSIVNHSVGTVAVDEKMLLSLEKAARIVDDIYKLQVHSNNLIWQRQLESAGEKVELEIFHRYAGPWCVVLASKQCNAIASKPANRKGDVFWPMGMSRSEFDHMSKGINSRELLSPFSLVVRDGDSRLKAVSYVDDIRFSSLFGELSVRFLEAASYGSSKQKPLLLQFAQMAKDGDMHTLGMTEKSLGATVGDWRVYFGAFDTNLDPYGVKRSFELTVARPYLPIGEMLSRYRGKRAEIVGAYRELFEEKPVVQFEESDDVLIEVVDIWLAAGRARYVPDNGIRTFQLPTGASQNTAQPKVVISINGFSKQLDALNSYLRQLFPTGMVGLDAVLANHVAKEFLSVVQPRSATLVTNKDGRKISVKRLLGKKTNTVSQVLNWLGAIWLLHYERETNQVTDESVNDRIAALLADLVRGAVSQNENARNAAQWILKTMIEEKALVFDAVAGSFSVNNDSFLAIAMAHWVKLNRCIRQGDSKGVNGILQQMAAVNPVDTSAENSRGNSPLLFLDLLRKTVSEVKNGKKVVFQYQIVRE